MFKTKKIKRSMADELKTSQSFQEYIKFGKFFASRLVSRFSFLLLSVLVCFKLIHT